MQVSVRPFTIASASVRNVISSSSAEPARWHCVLSGPSSAALSDRSIHSHSHMADLSHIRFKLYHIIVMMEYDTSHGHQRVFFTSLPVNVSHCSRMCVQRRTASRNSSDSEASHPGLHLRLLGTVLRGGGGQQVLTRLAMFWVAMASFGRSLPHRFLVM